MPVIDTLEQQLKDVQERAQALIDGDSFDPDNPEYRALNDEAEKLTRSIRAQSEWTQRKATTDEATTVIRRAQMRAQQTADHDQPLGSWGELFTRSQQFQGYNGYGTSGRVDVPNLETRAVSLPIKTTDLPSGLLAGNRYLEQAAGLYPLLNLIPTVQTSLNAFPVWGTQISDGGAAVVPEGDAKPPLDIAEAKIDVSLDLVAVYTQATRQVLEDVAMARSIIDTHLRRAVLKKFEELAVAALLAANLPTASAPHSGGTLQGAIRLGMAKVQAAGWNPTVVAVNPDDSASIDVAALGNQCCNGDNYWGLRVVPVNGLTAGTAIVGDFGSGATTYERYSGVSLFVTDSHADTFIHNVFTFLAEARRKTVIERVDAFAKVDVASS
jgi:hypothetical protein